MSKPSTRLLRWLLEAAVFASRGKIAARRVAGPGRELPAPNSARPEAEGKLFLAAKP